MLSLKKYLLIEFDCFVELKIVEDLIIVCRSLIIWYESILRDTIIKMLNRFMWKGEYIYMVLWYLYILVSANICENKNAPVFIIIGRIKTTKAINSQWVLSMLYECTSPELSVECLCDCQRQVKSIIMTFFVMFCC